VGIGLSSHFVRSRKRRLLQLSLQSVFSIPLKTCIQHVFIALAISFFAEIISFMVEAAGIEPHEFYSLKPIIINYLV